MNKAQQKQYDSYVNECGENNETPLTTDEWQAEIIKAEEQEKDDYLNYQAKVAGRNKVNKVAFEANTQADKGNFTPEKIMTKEEWLKAGKPTGKGKHEKFTDLVEPRTSKVLDAIEKLKPLYRPNYESTLEERKQVITALKDAVAKLETHFTAEKAKKATVGFKLQSLQSQETQKPPTP